MTYCVLYSTPATWTGKDFSIELMGCTINFFRGKKEFIFSQLPTKYLILGESTDIKSDRVTTEDGRSYIAIYVNHIRREEGPSLSQASTNAAKVMAFLCCAVSANLFDKKVAEGTIIKNKNDFKIGGAFHCIERRPAITRGMILKTSNDVDSEKKSDKRFSLMSTFFYRAWPLDTSEEKFLLLWTILEIYPMEDTPNIKPVRKLLKEIAFKGLSNAEIENRIGIGKLYRLRCDIVHDGYVELETHKLTRSIGTLLDITRATMRHYLGLPYDGELDKYPVPS